MKKLFASFLLIGLGTYLFYHLTNQQVVHKRAKVLALGASRGKNFYHRYWVIEFDGKQEKFWVYAAYNTEKEGKRTYATYSDPEPGGTLVLTGREGVFGFSYDHVLWILNAKGKVICE